MDAVHAHPAPHRDRIAPWRLWVGIFGAPAAWSVQEIATYAVTAHTCYPTTTPLDSADLAPAWWLSLALVAAALAVAGAAGWVAHRSWKNVRTEAAGSHLALLEAGEGRTRFMAVSGMILSGAFFFGILMHGINLVLVPVCG